MLNTVLALLLLLQATAARPGVVTGQLQTKEGTPAAAIRISALPAPPPNILPSDGQNYYATTAPASTALTDAQGRYRLANLAPGRYFIIARVFGYSTFYPATTSADGATVVTVGADAPIEGINFTVLMPPGGRVIGRVNTPPASGVRETAVLSGLDLGELLETPVGADGSFAFGHLPKGSYLLSLFPTPPGMPSRPFRIDETDTRVDLVRPTLRAVSGRVVSSGPLPTMLLGFSTETSYVTVPINPDGTFRTELQPARHQVVLAGVPAGAGYSLGSVRLGNRDASQGVTVGAGDVSGVVVTVVPRAHLPRLRGKVGGVPAADLANARVELTGRSITPLEATVQKDGSFEFPAVPPGTYRVRVPQVPAIAPSYVVVGSSDTEVQIGTAAR